MAACKVMNVHALFSRDHEKLSEMLNVLELGPPGRRSLELLNSLSACLLRHFDEEEQLYEKYKVMAGAKIPVFFRVLGDHETIRKMVADAKREWEEGVNIDISELIFLLRQHKNVEENLLYPELERSLDEHDKEKVFDRLVRS